MNSRFCSLGKLLPYLIYLLLSFILMLCWRPAQAQQHVSRTRPLSIGDTVPDVLIPQVLNYKNSTAKISDFGGKLLILDFWATWCKPCVMMIPRMDSIEKQFHGRVQFLPVSYQSKQEITVFREKLAKRTGQRITGPEVVSDTLLKSLFNYNAIPHYVWIDSDRRVVAITGMEEIKEEKINAFLSGKSTNLSKKTDVARLGYSAMDGPLAEFVGKSQLRPKAYHTFFSPYIKGLRSQAILKEPGDKQEDWRITLTNVLPTSLYKYAYGEGRRFFSMNTISLETKDSLNFHNNFTGSMLREWIPSHTYCYELVVPQPLHTKAFEILRNDLVKLLPAYTAKIEKRERKVLALIRTSDQDKIASKAEHFSESFDKFNYQVRRKSMTDFVTGLNGIYMNGSKLVIVDMTNYKGFIDLDLDVNFSQTDDVNKGLARYDLKLVERTANIDILVISDVLTTAY